MTTSTYTDYTQILETLTTEHDFLILRSEDGLNSPSRGHLLVHSERVLFVDLYQHFHHCGTYTCLHIFGSFKPRSHRRANYLHQALQEAVVASSLTYRLNTPLHTGYSQGVVTLRGYTADFEPCLRLLEDILEHTDSCEVLQTREVASCLLPLAFKSPQDTLEHTPVLSPAARQTLVATVHGIERQLNRDLFAPA